MENIEESPKNELQMKLNIIIVVKKKNTKPNKKIAILLKQIWWWLKRQSMKNCNRPIQTDFLYRDKSRNHLEEEEGRLRTK